mgnify:FL=1
MNRLGEIPRSAPSTRTRGGRVTIRPDIHARFLRILAKVDGAVEARPAQAQSTRTMLGVDASDIKGGRTKRRAKSEGEWSGSWDNAIEHAEEE